ncbi:DIP1984 family protein [Bacillus sp. FJAT-29790]|uniref:DIP1984 family protein n=1 Tax=Bacillus sp. FJAT-29790 TaxID=1895002 RepID=UPI001C2440B2|nr:DIP1984 family protein [Bacillus sp. FJAT-29790]MBU8878040.1 DIP1984 family protein [Bacillus sp. FJAT-29790]
MSKISLAVAVKLKSVLSKRIHELEEEMGRVAYIDMEKGSQLPKQARNLIEVEKDIEEVRKDFRLLDRLMYKANIENEIIFNNESLAIVEAIEFASQLRARARKYKEFGSTAKEEFLYPLGDSSSMVKVAMFDPEDYRLKALDMERQANRLSNLINAKNYAVELDFDSDRYF